MLEEEKDSLQEQEEESGRDRTEGTLPLEEGKEETGSASEAAGIKKKESAKEKSAPAEEDTEQAAPPVCPEAAIEAILFAVGNSVKISRLCEVLGMNEMEMRDVIRHMQEEYEKQERGITLTELEDAVQLGTKGEYYEYLVKLARNPKRMSLSDTVIETLSIIAYKQPVTRTEIERIRGVSCEHALNRLLEYELIEEVGRLDAPGRPLLFGTTEQFLRSFGVKSISELPTMSAELLQDFKEQAEAEAEADLNVEVEV